MDVSLFTQIGFVVLVGLASKNAILIVEFAKQSQEAGVPRREATLAACRLRLRPILMTSFAFIFGVVPLVLAEGAGAEMRRSLGTAVFGGMLGVTLFGIFLTPVFYYVIQRFGSQTREESRPADEPPSPPPGLISAARGTLACTMVDAGCASAPVSISAPTTFTGSCAGESRTRYPAMLTASPGPRSSPPGSGRVWSGRCNSRRPRACRRDG